MRKISVQKGKLQFSDNVESFYEKKVTRFGTGAKIDASKDMIGKKVYVLVVKDE